MSGVLEKVSFYPFKLDFSNEGTEYARFPFVFDGSPVKNISCIISGRSAGDMGRRRDVPPNENPFEGNKSREAFFDALGIDPAYVFANKQIHSRTVVTAGEDFSGKVLEADGIISNNNDYFLSVTVADCLPVFLCDTENGSFGLVHSGWKGTGIALNALKLIQEKFGTRPEAVAAVLGPCIRSCCYKVDAERAAAYEKEFGSPEFDPVTIKREDGFYLDMQSANAGLLARAGVRNIAVCQDCTFTDERLGSFRREGQLFTGMMALCGYFAE